MTIFESIRQDHDIQRKLADELIQTSGSSQRRKEVFEEFKKELQAHAEAEERYFYIPLFQEDMTQDHARHGVAEHHEIDELIEKLEKTDMSNAAWLQYAKDLKDKVCHHLDDEEHKFFQLAGKVLTEGHKSSLGKKYRSAMQERHAGYVKES
ncbi:hemerythrin domain-containing protein [Limibacter armeniacum]|uniref:hemerythrin domain-containing protein n=1 Tax=Limibacter armeniacum TaxID=466084 RepID=UPI002FE59997